MTPPMPQSGAAVLSDLVARNGGGDMYLYMQVSRGAEEGRNHALARRSRRRCSRWRRRSRRSTRRRAPGVAAVTLPDKRWGRCDIKTTALLANVLPRESPPMAARRRPSCSTAAGCAKALRARCSSCATRPWLRRPTARRSCPARRATSPAAVRPAGSRCGSTGSAQAAAADEIRLAFATRGILPVTLLDGAPVGQRPARSGLRAPAGALCGLPRRARRDAGAGG